MEFTQQAFDDLLDKMISWTETIYSRQECPGHDCTRDPHLFDEWKDYEHRENECYNSFNPYWDAWRGDITVDEWWNRFGWLMNGNYPYFDNDGNDYRDYISSRCEYYHNMAMDAKSRYENSRVCVHEHNLHSIGLDIISKEAVMDSWGFDENDKQWVEMTYQFFINNPDIQTN